MARPKGSPKLGGRKKGTPNKDTRTIREAWIDAFRLVNAKVPLDEWGAENPDKFYALATKLIPVDVTSGGKPIAPNRIEVQLVAPDDRDP